MTRRPATSNCAADIHGAAAADRSAVVSLDSRVRDAGPITIRAASWALPMRSVTEPSCGAKRRSQSKSRRSASVGPHSRYRFSSRRATVASLQIIPFGVSM